MSSSKLCMAYASFIGGLINFGYSTCSGTVFGKRLTDLM
jgi:hypothetical protein